jgi:hypothetical protein
MKPSREVDQVHEAEQVVFGAEVLPHLSGSELYMSALRSKNHLPALQRSQIFLAEQSLMKDKPCMAGLFDQVTFQRHRPHAYMSTDI